MANDHKVDIIVSVKDLATRNLDNLTQKVKTLSKLSSSKIGTGFSAFNSSLDESIRKMDKLANSLYKYNMYTSSISRNLRNIAGLGVVLGGALGVSSMSTAVDFQYKMATAQSRMEVSPQVNKKVSDYILNNLNRQVAATPNQLGDLAITLGQGGISSYSDMKSLLKTTSYFAEAVDAVPDQAAEMVISAAKGFGISMDKSSTITDKLTNALNKSLLQVDEMPHAIGELSGRAKMYGQSLDSSLVALMAGRNEGMSAAQTSQNLLAGLRQISYIGNQMTLFPQRRKYYQELGIDTSFFDTKTKKLKEFPDIVASLEKTLIGKGFTNNKYHVNNMDDFHKLVSQYGGKVPDDFWNSMKAMPLISRTFGAAGMAPIMMGLQAQYQETNPDTGEKTGPVYYGSEALKKMENDLKHSSGSTDKTHDIISNTAKFQLDVLKGVWQSGQIKLMNDSLPLLKTTTQLISDWISGKNSNLTAGKPNQRPQGGFSTPLESFNSAVNSAADNYTKDGHPVIGNFIRGGGHLVSNSIQMKGIVKPLASQIGGQFSDLTKDNWGDSLLTMPFHAIANITKFITGVGKDSKDLNNAISSLPKNLQDPAKLVSSLVKGGFILLASGALVKVLELTIRGASATLKGLKMGKDITMGIKDFIVRMITGATKDNSPVKDALKNTVKTMNVEAAVVNVYGGKGKGGGLPDTTAEIEKGGKKVPKPKVPTIAEGPGGGTLSSLVKYGKYVPLSIIPYMVYEMAKTPHQTAIEGHYKAITGEIPKNFGKPPATVEEANKNTTKFSDKEMASLKQYVKSTSNNTAQLAAKAVITQLPKSIQDKKAAVHNQQMYNMLYKNVDNKTTNIKSSIVSGFNEANKRLQNVQLSNNVSVNVQPQINISGDLSKYINVQTKNNKSTVTSNNHSPYRQDYLNNLNNSLLKRRLIW